MTKGFKTNFWTNQNFLVVKEKYANEYEVKRHTFKQLYILFILNIG